MECSGANVSGRPLRTALIGLGARGAKHLSVLNSCSAVELVGVSDIDDSTYSAVPPRVERFADAGQLLSSVDPAAAVLALPHDVYPSLLRECLTRSVSCLKEKPFARSAAEASEILGWVEATRTPLVIAAQRRYSQAAGQLLGLVERRGRPVAFDYVYTLGLDRGAYGWRGSRSVAGGGAILDMGYHVIDLITRLMGIPEDIVVMLDHSVRGRPGPVENGALLHFRYPRGESGSVRLSRILGPATERATFWFDGCTAIVDGSELHLLHAAGRTQLATGQSTAELLHAQLHGFVRQLAEGGVPMKELEGDRDVMTVIDMCYRSAFAERPGATPQGGPRRET